MKTRFNEAEADRAVDFFHRRLRHTKGRWAGSRFVLDDWQEVIIRDLFGWQRWSPELKEWVRKFRKAYIELPKKNGKSELGAGIAGKLLYQDNEGGPEVFSLAADKKQAGLVFNVLADMVSMEPALAQRSEVARSRIAHHGVIYVPRTRGVYKVLPGDVDTVDGINPSAAVLDELHRQPGRELYDLMDESFGTRTQPLFVILTTAGYAEEGAIGWEVHQYAKKVRDGILSDPYLYVVMHSLEPEDVDGDKWADEALWRKVNPALSGFNTAGIDEMRRLAAEAAESPAKVAAFKRYRLNVWLPRAAGTMDMLVDIRAWDRSAGMDVTPADGAPLYVGLDMAASDDIAALVGVSPVYDCKQRSCAGTDGPCWNVVARHWLPSRVLGEDAPEWSRSMKLVLADWAERKLIDVVDGDMVDDAGPLSVLREWASRWDVRVIAKDPWNSKQIGVELLDAGLPVVDHQQTIAAMATPTDDFIAAVLAAKFHHGGHSVLRWQIANAVARSDPDGRLKPDKRKSTGKIDGVVAAVMAVGRGVEEEVRQAQPAVGWL